MTHRRRAVRLAHTSFIQNCGSVSELLCNGDAATASRLSGLQVVQKLSAVLPAQQAAALAREGIKTLMAAPSHERSLLALEPPRCCPAAQLEKPCAKGADGYGLHIWQVCRSASSSWDSYSRISTTAGRRLQTYWACSIVSAKFCLHALYLHSSRPGAGPMLWKLVLACCEAELSTV